MRALILALLVPISSYGAGKIVNADIAASGTANIARNKLAAGTAYAWCVNDVSGFQADTAVTASRAVATDANGAPVASATTATELGYVNGVTSAIQTQLNGKQASGNYITALTGDVTASGPGSVAASVAKIQGTVVSGTTGSTNVVFSTSPSLTTPVLGVASATSVNKVAITAPATGSTLTIADGKTLTCNNTLTLSGTDASTLNIGAGGTLGTAAFTAASAYASSTLTGAHILVGNVSNVATDVAVSGDASLSNAGAVTVSKVNGVAYGTSPGTNTVPVVTSANTVTYEAVPNAALANASTTVNGTTCTLGSSCSPTAANPGVVSKTANYTITTADNIVKADASGAAFTLTLETAVGNTGLIHYILRTDNTPANALTLNTTSSQTIGGSASGALKLFTLNESLEVVSDGTNWQILSHKSGTSWASFTPTGTWNTNTTYAGQWRRHGDNAEVQWYLTFAGNPNAVTLSLNFPAGVTIDTAKLASGTAATGRMLADGCNIHNTSTAYWGSVYMLYQSTTSVTPNFDETDAESSGSYQGRVVNATGPYGTWGAGSVINCHVSVPVANWFD